MKFLYDFFPVVLFFVTYKVYDIFVATAVIIAATILQVGFFWLKNRRFEKMHLITLVLVIVLGGITLFLHDEIFIKWKPTIVNWLFAVAFLGSQLFTHKNLIQRMMESHLTVSSEQVWIRLNLMWIAFFTAVGFLNLYVAFSFDTNTWVNFKLFGLMGLTFLFVIAQGFYLTRYIVEEEKDEVAKP